MRKFSFYANLLFDYEYDEKLNKFVYGNDYMNVNTYYFYLVKMYELGIGERYFI